MQLSCRVWQPTPVNENGVNARTDAVYWQMTSVRRFVPLAALRSHLTLLLSSHLLTGLQDPHAGPDVQGSIIGPSIFVQAYNLTASSFVCLERHQVKAHKITLVFLQQLLTCSDLCTEGSWSLGNSILGVCRNVLRFHNTDNVFQELGNLLHLLFTKYNDIDIRDRARFYYALLTNLSSEKLSGILASSSPVGMATTQTLTSLVTGSANFTVAAPVQHLDEPKLQLTRSEKRMDSFKIEIDGKDDDVFENYYSVIKSGKKKITVPISYYLHFATPM
ncbi:uncharacterized protein LOC144348410 [Saccoglossus kowalevskii]